MNTIKKIVAAASAGVLLFGTSACTDTDADVVNSNMTQASENFEINRNIVVYNLFSDEYVFQAQGRCDVTPKVGRIFVTCKVADGEGPDSYKRHQIYSADNMGTIVEQLDATETSAYHYRVTYKPQSVLPDVDFRGSTSEGPTKQD